jgi:beta-lysine 5,6-aminomutase beta subunit
LSEPEFIKPYGDTLGDGRIQISFTLPVELSARAKKAAEIYATSLNCENVSVVYAAKISEGYTYFVIFADAKHELDFSKIQAVEAPKGNRDFYEINAFVKEKIGRKVVIVGATIGTDAHTVGIDAILNMKGYDHDYGLERYPEFRVYNLGAQVSSEDLLAQALEVNADGILISQTVTQKDSHIRNFTEFMEILEAEQMRDRFVTLIGGARITQELAIELGYDAGFGPGTKPSSVADFLVSRMVEHQS